MVDLYLAWAAIALLLLALFYFIGARVASDIDVKPPSFIGAILVGFSIALMVSIVLAGISLIVYMFFWSIGVIING